MGTTMTVLVSPTDRDVLAGLGDKALVSSLPEAYGADVLLITEEITIGLQRKEIPHDFISSVQDGRLTKETSLLAEKCDIPFVVGEGHFKYFPNGSVASSAPREVQRAVFDRFTKKSIRKLIFEIMMIKHCHYIETNDMADTIQFIIDMIEFIETPNHTGLSRMPKTKGAWGAPTVPELQMGILQAFPGVGPGLAKSIYNHFGHTPLMWTCTVDELNAVPKIGANRAWKLYSCLPPTGTNP
jgi:ERCC4-type nuclease